VLLLSAAFVALCATVAGATVAVASGSYVGRTSERVPVTFKISRRAITNFATTDGYNGSCGQGGGPGFSIHVGRNIPINAAGHFSINIALVAPVKQIPNHKGTLTGTAAGSHVTGSIVDVTQEHAKFCQHGYNETFKATRT
jgi:hypothetical protein